MGRSILPFIDYLRKSKTSPFKNLNDIFARGEYQKERGNISHSHMLVELYFEQMKEDEKSFVDDIIWHRVFDILKTEEVDIFKYDGVLNTEHDIYIVYKNAMKVLPHCWKILSCK